MKGYTIISVKDVENAAAKHGWPGEMRFMTKYLGTEQVALSYRKMPQHTGGKGGYGHRHKTQEEVIYVIKGELEVKLDDEVKIVKAGQVVRVAPHVVRSIWNAQPGEAELLLISTKIDDLKAEVEFVQGFWPAD